MSVLTELPKRCFDLERAFEDSQDEKTAAYFHISISHKKGSKIRVEVDAEVDEEAVRRLIDLGKVRLMREQRQKLHDEWEAVPYDDRYRIKPSRKAPVEDNRNKLLTKVAEQKKAKKCLTDAERKSRKPKLNKSAASAPVKPVGTNKLPFFAQPFLKLKDARVDEDWTRPAPPRYHGLHMHTKCYQKKEPSARWCEKLPIFQRYLSTAEALNGGPLSKHVQRRSQIYDGLCQELMSLEQHQSKLPRVYSPLKTHCYDCQRYANAAEAVFFKSSYQDQNRNAIRSQMPSVALQRKLY
ncbi:Hypothetical predicted protein [Cloeon dipterum]|uniref:Uncharacterized protein n=1 Tax=Cloeon dipterum TaxID=197152 RepID=A0A8S1CIT7_9INSE|nr:Hypothetical predicted protein [Cloeon dipterum]